MLESEEITSDQAVQMQEEYMIICNCLVHEKKKQKEKKINNFIRGTQPGEVSDKIFLWKLIERHYRPFSITKKILTLTYNLKISQTHENYYTPYN